MEKRAIIDPKVTHQGIGGKEIIIEREMTIGDILDTNFNNMPIAMTNFIMRRTDIIDEKHENMKVYYGHVGYLGYFVAEDEIEFIEE